MAISKKMYSFDDEVHLHFLNDTYIITFDKTKLTTTNPKKAIELFAKLIENYLNVKMAKYLLDNGRNTETGCKQHMSCEMCLVTGKYENQDCYKSNPEQFYKMFNKSADEEKQVAMTADEINKIRYEEAVNINDGSNQRVGTDISDHQIDN